jgi:hypothetical protein
MSQRLDFLELHRGQPSTPGAHPAYNKVIATDTGLQMILPDGRLRHLLDATELEALALELIAEQAAPKTGNVFTVETVPDPALNTGRTIFVTDGNEGLPCGAISDGTQWLVLTVGTEIAEE